MPTFGVSRVSGSEAVPGGIEGISRGDEGSIRGCVGGDEEMGPQGDIGGAGAVEDWIGRWPDFGTSECDSGNWLEGEIGWSEEEDFRNPEAEGQSQRGQGDGDPVFHTLGSGPHVG